MIELHTILLISDFFTVDEVYSDKVSGSIGNSVLIPVEVRRSGSLPCVTEVVTCFFSDLIASVMKCLEVSCF